MSEPVIVSAADLGSNTIKIMHARRTAHRAIEPLGQATNTVRLGAGIEATGMIEPERMDACIQFLIEQETIGRALGSTAFVGVATEALRIASNGQLLLARIAAETAWDVRVIDGLEEARLTFVGLRDQVPVEHASAIVDIGGGSTEIILVEHGEAIWQRSLHVGSGRLADRYFQSDPPGVEATNQAFAAALEELAPLEDIPTNVETIVFSGGNGVFLRELVHQLFPGEPLTIHTAGRVLQHLAIVPARDTVERLGIVLQRARVLPAGVAVALAVLTRTHAGSAIGVPSGIQLGLIAEYCA